jgi:hypothetical protein
VTWKKNISNHGVIHRFEQGVRSNFLFLYSHGCKCHYSTQMVRTHSAFFFSFSFGHGIAQEMENGTTTLKGPGIRVPSYAQRTRRTFRRNCDEFSFTLLPHRCIQSLLHCIVYIRALLAAVLDGWLAYNKSCFNSSSMHILDRTFPLSSLILSLIAIPVRTREWFRLQSLSL